MQCRSPFSSFTGPAPAPAVPALLPPLPCRWAEDTPGRRASDMRPAAEPAAAAAAGGRPPTGWPPSGTCAAAAASAAGRCCACICYIKYQHAILYYSGSPNNIPHPWRFCLFVRNRCEFLYRILHIYTTFLPTFTSQTKCHWLRQRRSYTFLNRTRSIGWLLSMVILGQRKHQRWLHYLNENSAKLTMTKYWLPCSTLYKDKIIVWWHI